MEPQKPQNSPKRPRPRISLTSPNAILPAPPGTYQPWDKINPTPHNKVFTVREIAQEYVNSPRWDNLTEGSKERYLSCFRIIDGLTLYTGSSLFSMKAYAVTYATADYLQRVLILSNRKPATIRFYYAILNNVFDYACRNGRVYLNPFLRPRIKVNNERDVTWTSEQVDRAISKAKELNYNLLALYILLCYETAQRPWKDLFNLTWNSLKTVAVADDKECTYFDFEISKTKTHIMVPISDRVIKALNEWPKISSYIMVNENGERLNRGFLQAQLTEVKLKAELPSNLLFLDLRRTAITELAERGCSQQEIEAMTGWRCPEAVIRRYARVRLKTAQHALQKREQGKLPDNTGLC